MPKRFEVVWQASPAERSVVLRSTVDANEATMAFHEELARLTIQEVPGEVFVRNGIHAHHLLLRQPLKHHKTRDW